MGEVYYAEDTELKRPVALKRVAHKLGNDPEARRQILREARRASALSSEHIASIYDVVEDLDELLLVMEYVEATKVHERYEYEVRDSLGNVLVTPQKSSSSPEECVRESTLSVNT